MKIKNTVYQNVWDIILKWLEGKFMALISIRKKDTLNEWPKLPPEETKKNGK